MARPGFAVQCVRSCTLDVVVAVGRCCCAVSFRTLTTLALQRRYWRGLNLFSEVNLLLEQDFSGGVSAGLHVGDFQFDVFGYALPVFGATSQFLNAGTVASSTMSTSDVVLMCCDIYTILYMVFVVAALALKSQVVFRWVPLFLLAGGGGG